MLTGEPVDRRTALRLAAGAAVGLPAALAACGKTVHPPGNRVAYVIDANGTSPPTSDLVRLITARARAVGMAPTFTTAAGAGLAAALRLQTRLGRFDPATNSTPAVSDLIVVGASDRASIEPLAATAIARGVKIVSYPVAIRHQTAAITVDVEAGAAMLAEHAAAWARTRPADHGRVLLVLPPAAQIGVNPYAPAAATLERAFRATLAQAAPALPVSTTTAWNPAGGRLAVAHALKALPDLRIVLVWDDDTALGAAQALGSALARLGWERLYVGGLGAPAVTSRATFAELAREGVLRAVVAARPRDLARALVDLPKALLAGRPARDVKLPLALLQPGTPVLAEYAADYARHPPSTSYVNAQLNPGAQEQRTP